jgi:hypothetical protein
VETQQLSCHVQTVAQGATGRHVSSGAYRPVRQGEGVGPEVLENDRDILSGRRPGVLHWWGGVGRREVSSVASTVRVGSIVLRVDDLRRQLEFWSVALDYVPGIEEDDFALLRPRDGVGPNLSLDMVRSEVHIPPRIHLDLYTDDQAAEVERLIGLGATEVHWSKRPPDADYVILADPEGNRFCVVDASGR